MVNGVLKEKTTQPKKNVKFETDRKKKGNYRTRSNRHNRTINILKEHHTHGELQLFCVWVMFVL